MNDPRKMLAREFAGWWYCIVHNRDTQYAELEIRLAQELDHRDAYRNQAILEDALERAKNAVRSRCSETCTCYGGLRDAILNKPEFVRGQVVRYANKVCDPWMLAYDPQLDMDRDVEPVRAHIDDAGRVIVDEVER
jgi:hypothetical protein